jgi:hypothetical protein
MNSLVLYLRDRIFLSFNSTFKMIQDRITSSHYALFFGDIHVLQGELYTHFLRKDQIFISQDLCIRNWFSYCFPELVLNWSGIGSRVVQIFISFISGIYWTFTGINNWTLNCGYQDLFKI